MKYIVETPYPYRFYPCENITEARKKCKELRKQGIKASIIYVTENENDYIVNY